MHSVPSPRPPSLAAHRPFVFFVSARGFSDFAYQIGTVAVGSQVGRVGAFFVPPVAPPLS